MLALLIYYIVLPILAGYGVIALIKRWAPYEPPEHLRALWREHPMLPKTFRAVRVDGEGAQRRGLWLGDFDSLPAAVDAIYLARDQAREKEPGAPAAFIAYNPAMEALEEVDV